jgi:anti-anti-sigma factor
VVEGGAYITFSGILDISRREEVATELERRAHPRSVVINLARVEHVDSLVLGLFVSFRRRFIESGGSPDAFTVLVRKDGGLDRMFEATALDRLFSIAYTHDEDSTPEAGTSDAASGTTDPSD